MPRPDRRMGTREMVSGPTSVVVYSKPRGVWSCIVGKVAVSIARHAGSRGGHCWGMAGKLTLGPAEAVMVWARASQPSIMEISCTNVFTSLGLVFLDRSWLSFANKHGWLETWTLGGRDGADMMGGWVED